MSNGMRGTMRDYFSVARVDAFATVADPSASGIFRRSTSISVDRRQFKAAVPLIP
jgi:hypothetical protein